MSRDASAGAHWEKDPRVPGKFQSGEGMSVDDFGFLFLRVEVRDVQRGDGAQGQGEYFLGARPVARLPQVGPDLPQRAKGPRPIEPLTLTVLTEIRHRSTPPPALILTQVVKGETPVPRSFT
jgi:hypothetical protein